MDLSVMPMVKYLMDPAGQYSKASVVSLNFDRRPQKPVNQIGEASDYSIPYEELIKE